MKVGDPVLTFRRRGFVVYRTRSCLVLPCIQVEKRCGLLCRCLTGCHPVVPSYVSYSVTLFLFYTCFRATLDTSALYAFPFSLFFALSFRSRPTILRCAFLPSTGTLRAARERGPQRLPFCPNALRRRVTRLAGDGQRVHPDAPEPATILGQRMWDTSQRRHSVGMSSLIALCGTIRGGKRDLTPWMRAHGAPQRHCPSSSAV